MGKADAKVRQLLKHTPKHERADREASLSRHGHEPAAGVKGRGTQRQQAAFVFVHTQTMVTPTLPGQPVLLHQVAAHHVPRVHKDACAQLFRCCLALVGMGQEGWVSGVWFECGHTCLKDGEELGIVQCHVVDVGSNL